jgi:cytoskeletal protein CcmA (bactofilin family)
MASVPGTTGEIRTNLFRRNEVSEERPDGPESLIDAASSIDGVFTVGHHLRIEGEAKGEIICQGTVTIADGARVSAKVSAASVIVAGMLEGEIVCRERLQILPSGRVSGTVTTGSLIIQEGALYEGQLHMRTTPGDSRAGASAGRVAPAGPAGRGRNGRPADNDDGQS